MNGKIIHQIEIRYNHKNKEAVLSEIKYMKHSADTTGAKVKTEVLPLSVSKYAYCSVTETSVNLIMSIAINK